jgi:16S rRNA (adenine1518-N6/adenine1519-N6)-dimethyltransferase
MRDFRLMQVRKRFGQHFLHDPAIIRRIVDTVAPVVGERLVEVGPGRGALTWGLLARAGDMDVIEIDRDLARALTADSRAEAHLRVHVENVLDTDFVALRGAGAPLRIVGNLPYNISTPLLFRLLKQRAAIGDMHFMLQKEVADRMAAPPGGKEYGRLTVMLAAYAEVETLFDVGPGAFTPRRWRAPDVGDGRLLSPPQDLAQRPEESPDGFGYRSLRHRSQFTSGDAGAGAIRVAGRALLPPA